MASKPGERKLQILQTLAAMLESPRAEKVTTLLDNILHRPPTPLRWGINE